MYKKLLLINWLVFSTLIAFGQLPTFEWRLENGTLTSPTTYTVDVYLYNKGASSFELRGGTIAFLTNSAWRNGGTITTAKLASELVVGQQSSATTTYVTTAPEYWRQTITSLGAGSGTTIAAGTRILIFKMQLSNTVAYSTTASPNFAWKFNAAPSAGWNYTNGIGNPESVVSNTANTINQLNCHTPTYWIGSSWVSKSVRNGADTTVIPSASKDAVIYTGTLPSGNLTCRNYSLNTGAIHNLGANTLNIGYNLANNGTLNASSGSINLAGTTATQTTKQTISGTSSVTTNNLSLVTGTSASLSTSINVNNNLTLTTGKISINNNNLTLGNSATISGASSAAYIVADSAGSLVINNVGIGGKTGAILFPVGTSASYNPISITNDSISDNFWVSVKTGVDYAGVLLTTNVVDKKWSIKEAVSGGSKLTVKLQWNTADELPSFARALSYVSMGENTGGSWISSNAAAAAGSGPYTQTLSGITSLSTFGSFAVGSNNALNQQSTFTINASAGSNGSISPSGIITVNWGVTQRFTFTPNAGNKVDSVIVDGIKVDSIVGYTFNNVTSNRSIKVTFKCTPTNSILQVNYPSSSLPYIFNGNSYYNSFDGYMLGINQVLTSTSGCDSTIVPILNVIELPSYLPKNGLLAWYPFTGQFAWFSNPGQDPQLDESGNVNNGTVNGATRTTDRFGRSNSAYSFDGTTNNISVPNIAATGNSARSIFAWIKTTSTIGKCIVGTGGSGTNAGEFNLVMGYGPGSTQYPGKIGVMGGNFTTGGNDYYPNSGPSVNDNLWHNVGVTFDGINSLKVYIDGVLVNSNTITYNTIGQLNFIGFNNHNGSQWDGLIDEVGIWNRALTQSEITSLYDNCAATSSTTNLTIPSIILPYTWNGLIFNASGSQTKHLTNACGYDSAATLNLTVINTVLPSYLPKNGLLAWYPFNGNTIDESGNLNNGTVNGAILTNDRNGNVNKAYSFNNTSISANINTTSINNSQEYSVSFWVFQTTFVSTTSDYFLTFGSWSNNGMLSFSWEAVNLLGSLYSVSSFIEGENNTGNWSYYGGFNYLNFVNNWNNIVFTVKAGQTKIYFNGVLIATSVYSGLPNLPSNARFSSLSNGSLDDIGIWNRALTQTEITALYNGPIFTINANAGINGSITPSGIIKVDSFEKQRFTFIPNTGYKVDSVIVDGIKLDSIVGYTFNNITSNRSIRVTFTPITYTISTQTNSNGIISPTGNINIAYGGSQRILFTPNTGYKVDSVLVDGIKVDSIVGYTFNNVTSNRNIRVTFKALPTPNVAISSLHPTGTYLNTNTSNNILASYQLIDSVLNALLTSLSFTTQGTYTTSDIQSMGFKCWLNNSNDLTGATQIGTGQAFVGSGGVITFTGLSQNIPIGTSYILVTCDIANTAENGNTIGLASTPIGNFTFSRNTTIFGNSNLAAGNLFTINETGPVKMQYRTSNSYRENFSDIANWTNGFNSGIGAGRWAGVTISAGTIPNAKAITVSTANFQTSSSGAGIQRGSLTGNVTGTINFLSLGNTDNTSACAVDFFMDFTKRNADSLVFDAATVFNGTGNRNSTLRVYWSIDGTNFTELAGNNLPYTATNNIANSATIRVKLPSAFNNVSTCRLRFYYHNGTGGTTALRPKISIDNLQVTAICPIGTSTTNINSCTPYTWNGETYSTSGVYNKTFFGASAWGCDSVASLNLNINAISSFNPFQDTLKICGATYSLNSGAGYTSYLWNTGATTSTISPTRAGWYNVIVSNGTCSASDSVYLSLNNAKINKNDTTVCPNVVFSLIATDSAAILPLSYLWSNGTITSQTQLKANFASTYYCTISNGINSCTDTTRVKVNSISTFNPFPDTLNACGTPYPLNAGKGYVSYLWNTGSRWDTTNTYNTNWYKVTVNNGTCSATDSVYLSLDGARISASKTRICNGETVNLSAPQTKAYTWSTGAINTNILVKPTSTTKYYLTVNNVISSCIDSVTIFVDSLPVPNLQDSLKICGDIVFLNPGNFARYVWSNGDSVATTTAKASGMYKVKVTNIVGCMATDSVHVSLVKSKITANKTRICKGETVTLQADTTIGSLLSCAKTDLPSNLQSGLVAYYPFCGNANDASGNGNNGTVVGATLTSDRFGKANSAYDFNGTTNYVKMLNPGPLGSNSRSISVWAKLDSFNGSSCMVSYGLYTGAGNVFEFSIGDNGTCKGLVIDASGANALMSFPAGFNPYSWHLYTAVFNNSVSNNISQIQYYTDGNLQTTYCYNGSIGVNTLNNEPIYIGKLTAYNGRFFNGKIDEIGLWNRALTAIEVQQLYTTSASASQTQTYAWSNGSTSNAISVNPSTTTKYYLTVNNGISSCIDSVTIIVDSLPVPNLQDTLKVCGESTLLNPGSFAKYAWSNGDTSSTITPKTSGLYKVVVTNTVGCSAADSVLLSIINANILNNDSSIVAGTTITLRATGTGIISNPLSYVWSNGANTQNITVSPTQNTNYYCRVSNGVSSCADTVKIGVNVNINLKMYFEAFYENGSLKSSLNNADGMSDISLFDTIQIMLYDSINNSVVYSIKSIADTGGNCQILIPSAYANNRYYIGIKHRGSIETWTSSSVLLNNGIFYNFTNSASKAYGANLKDNGNGVYLIYNGDVNQDGAVDFADYPDLDIGSSNGDLGYLPTDLNGDGSVDFGDYPILDINSNDGIIAYTPIIYNAFRSNKSIKKSVLIK